jgi:hypothetical protein
LLLSGVALWGCGGVGARVTIVNASHAPLADLRVVGENDSTRVHPLAAGDSLVVRVHLSAEDALVLRGTRAGRPLSPMLAAYVEDGYRLRLVVDSTGFVGVKALGASH